MVWEDLKWYFPFTYTLFVQVWENDSGIDKLGCTLLLWERKSQTPLQNGKQFQALHVCWFFCQGPPGLRILPRSCQDPGKILLRYWQDLIKILVSFCQDLGKFLQRSYRILQDLSTILGKIFQGNINILEIIFWDKILLKILPRSFKILAKIRS